VPDNPDTAENDSFSFTKEPSIIEHKAYRDIWGRGLDSYLQWFYEAAVLLHELLHEEGSLYVHVDWHVSFYVKTMLDEIFGPERFVNEIVWKRQTAKGDVTQGARHMGRIHETIFLYTKTENYVWNPQYTPYDQEYVEAAYRNQDSDGRHYTLSDITAPGGAKASKGNPRYEFLGVTRYWRFSRDTMQRLHNEGKIVQTSPGAVPRQKCYLDEMPGVPLQDCPILTRKKSLAEEIAELDVSAFNCPVLPRKQDDAVAKTFRYEGYDIITLQKLIERDYSIPEPQTAEEVIGYYARRIAQDVKLPSQFSALAPKVRDFFETKAFGERVTLSEPAMIKAISSNVAQYVTVKTFVEALRKMVISELQPQLLHAGRSLSETAPFPWSRATIAASKCVFNLVPCDNEFEKEFAQFLQKADDVERFAKLPEQFGFVIEYTDNVGNLRYYEPDFVVLSSDGMHYIVETKGLEDTNVANKDRAAQLWCENSTKLASQSWAYLKVLQTAYKQLQPNRFEDLFVLEQKKLL